MAHFDRRGARIEDLSVVLLSHLHVDHSNDLPALVKGSYFIERTTDLPLYGVLRTLMVGSRGCKQARVVSTVAYHLPD